MNHCCNIVYWTLRNKLPWNFNRNSNIFIQENALEDVVCEMASILSRPQFDIWYVAVIIMGSEKLWLIQILSISKHFWDQQGTTPYSFISIISTLSIKEHYFTINVRYLSYAIDHADNKMPPPIFVLWWEYQYFSARCVPCVRHILRTSKMAWWRHQMEIFSALLAFVRGIHRSPMNSPQKGHWWGALMFSLICTWINGWVSNRGAGDLRRHRAHYGVIVMENSHRTVAINSLNPSSKMQLCLP